MSKKEQKRSQWVWYFSRFLQFNFVLYFVFQIWDGLALIYMQSNIICKHVFRIATSKSFISTLINILLKYKGTFDVRWLDITKNFVTCIFFSLRIGNHPMFFRFRLLLRYIFRNAIYLCIFVASYKCLLVFMLLKKTRLTSK